MISTTLPGPQPHDLLNAESHHSGSGIRTWATSQISVTVRVEGEPITFEGIESGSGWVLQRTLGPSLLSIVGLHWPHHHLELVRVPDPEPYITGFHDFLRSLDDPPQG